jgi:pyruvate kinase
MNSYKQDKIICTAGPACEKENVLRRLAQLASGFRLNVAHLDSDGLAGWLKRLADLRTALSKQFEIILDLQGAKVRIGRIRAVNQLPETVELFYGDFSDEPGRIPVPNQNVFSQTSPGERLFINDRKVILEIYEKKDEILRARVLQNGSLSSGKGLNSPDRVFEMARVTEKDLCAINLSRHIENVAYAISFVADGKEAALFRPLVDQSRLIAKIEQLRAFDFLDGIAEKFDELWLCRGDLGAEAGLRELGGLQRRFVDRISGLKIPCILAGEVLGSMVLHKQPSRAEIVQLYDALNSGFSGIVLSDETACGKNVAALADFVEFYFFQD